MITVQLKPLAVRLLLVLFFTVVSVALLSKSYNQSQDFKVFYNAGARIASGDLDIYRFSDANMPYKYAPAFAFAMVPFTLLPLKASKTLWAVFNLAALLYIALFLSKKLYKGRCYAGIAALAVLVNLQPLTDHFMDGQINLIILAAMLFGFDCLFRRGALFRIAGAGIIATAAFIKLYPLLIVLYFLRKRDFRPLLYGALAIAFVIAVPFLMVKYSSALHMYDMWRAILASSGHHLDLAVFKNQSLFGLLLRTVPEAAAHSFHRWISAGIVIAAFFAVSKEKHTGFNGPFIIDFSLVSFAMLLVCPLTWIHYYIFYIPFCVYLSGKLFYATKHRRFWWTGFAFLLISAVPTQAITGTAVRNFFFRHSNCVIETFLMMGYCVAAGKKHEHCGRTIAPSGQSARSFAEVRRSCSRDFSGG
jgi:alpha-1,2-mannosyltransferase